jgi:hypothetical protein
VSVRERRRRGRGARNGGQREAAVLKNKRGGWGAEGL